MSRSFVGLVKHFNNVKGIILILKRILKYRTYQINRYLCNLHKNNDTSIDIFYFLMIHFTKIVYS